MGLRAGLNDVQDKCVSLDAGVEALSAAKGGGALSDVPLVRIPHIIRHLGR